MNFTSDPHNISTTVISAVLNIIFGFVIGVLLYSIYNPPILLRGPNSKDIVDREFMFLGRTYRLDPIVCARP